MWAFKHEAFGRKHTGNEIPAVLKLQIWSMCDNGVMACCGLIFSDVLLNGLLSHILF